MVNFVKRKRVKKERKRKRKIERKKGSNEERNKRNPLSDKGHHFLFFFLYGDHFTAYVYIKPKYQVTYIKYMQF